MAGGRGRGGREGREASGHGPGSPRGRRAASRLLHQAAQLGDGHPLLLALVAPAPGAAEREEGGGRWQGRHAAAGEGKGIRHRKGCGVRSPAAATSPAAPAPAVATVAKPAAAAVPAVDQAEWLQRGRQLLGLLGCSSVRSQRRHRPGLACSICRTACLVASCGGVCARVSGRRPVRRCGRCCKPGRAGAAAGTAWWSRG